MNPHLLRLGIAGAVLAGATGCGSARAPGSAGAASLPARAGATANPFDRIVPGLSAAELQSLVGGPRERRPDSSLGAEATVWCYEHQLGVTVRQVSIGTREIPAVNPITGQTITVLEPVLADEFSTVVQVIEVVLVDDHVQLVRRSQRVDRKIH